VVSSTEIDVKVASGSDDWTTVDGTFGKSLALYYDDADGSQTWGSTENAWIDYRNTTSWFEARRAPWAEAMGLALYLKFDDEGKTIEDYSWHADWRDFWNHAIERPASTTGFKVYDGNGAPDTPAVSIFPASLTGGAVANDALLRADITRHSIDPDDDRLVYRFRWHQWLTADNGAAAGAPAALAFADTVNPDANLWDFGEDVWIDVAGGTAGAYDEGIDTKVTDGGDLQGWTTSDDAAGVTGVLQYADTDGTVGLSAGDDIWQDITTGGTAGQFDRGVDRMASHIAGEITSTLDLSVLGVAPGARYFASVVAVDEFGALSGYAVDVATPNGALSPAKPVVVSFTPAQAEPDEDLTATLRNADANATELRLTWYRNHDAAVEADPVMVAPGETYTFRLSSALTERADVWHFKAYANDGIGGVSKVATRLDDIEGTTTKVGVRVIGGGGQGINYGPSSPTVVVTPRYPLREDMLVCEASGSSDPEGDSFAYYYQWYQFQEDTGGVGSYEKVDGETSRSLSESQTSVGQRWQCRVYAEDVYGNRSPTESGNVVTIGITGSTANVAYEDNNTPDEAHRILPKSDPDNVDDPNVQEHAINPAGDQDWFWFLVQEGESYQTAQVVFETNNGEEMFNEDHMAKNDPYDTQLTLFDENLYPLHFADDWGVVGEGISEPGGTKYARFERELEPGKYYVKVTASDVSDYIAKYSAHLIITPVAGPSGPDAATEVVLTPSSPNSADDLVCEASGAFSGLGEDAMTYQYVWLRNGAVVPFGAATAESYEGTSYDLAHSTTSNVVSSKYTKVDEVWTCKVYAIDANGESSGVLSNSVTIGEAAWTHKIQVLKTFDDGTAAVQDDDQAVTYGWRFGATHGFDTGVDEDLPTGGTPPPGGPAGDPVPEQLPAGRSYSIGLQTDHTALSKDVRPYGALTSWYVKIELGASPVSCRLQWSQVLMPIADTPLTITQVDEANDFEPVYGTTVDMLDRTELIVSETEIAAMVARGDKTVTFRISLGGGDDFQTITLKRAWNLISFSVLPSNPAVAKVFTYNGVKVYAGTVWEYKNGGYIAVSEIEPKKGYWVYCPFQKDIQLTIYGLKVRGTLPLDPAWNLVGFVDDMDVPTAYMVTGGNGAIGDTIYYYNAATGAYLAADNTAGAKGLKQGLGYWVYANRRVDLPCQND